MVSLRGHVETPALEYETRLHVNATTPERPTNTDIQRPQYVHVLRRTRTKTIEYGV